MTTDNTDNLDENEIAQKEEEEVRSKSWAKAVKKEIDIDVWFVVVNPEALMKKKTNLFYILIMFFLGLIIQI